MGNQTSPESQVKRHDLREAFLRLAHLSPRDTKTIDRATFMQYFPLVSEQATPLCFPICSRKGMHFQEGMLRDRLFDTFDRNGDGRISFEEFSAGMAVFGLDDRSGKLGLKRNQKKPQAMKNRKRKPTKKKNPKRKK